MDSNIDTQSILPKHYQAVKEYTDWSPPDKGLTNIASTIDFPTKIQLNLPTNSSTGVLIRSGRTHKIAPVRLIPLSLEGRNKENVTANKRVPSFKNGLEAPSKFESSHVAVIVHNRPISEEFTKGTTSEKLNHKRSFKTISNLPERSLKLPSNASETSITDIEHADSSIKSKFKSKLFTARVTEEDISKQLRKGRNSECIPKELPLTELSQNSSLKKSGLSLFGEMTLARNFEHPSWLDNKSSRSSKHFDYLADVRTETNKDGTMVESIFLNSTKSPKPASIPQLLKDNPTVVQDPIGVSPQACTIKPVQPQTPESAQIQPRKLFQRKDNQATIRSPMLFAKKPSVNFPKPTTFSGQGSMTKVELPTPTMQEANGEVKVRRQENVEEEKNKQLEQTVPVKRKISIRKEHFHGEIRGNILRWKMGDFIGAGNFGQVYRAMEVESGRIIAVKTIPSTNLVNKELLNALEMELTILQKLKHRHIVQYIGHETIENSLHIYLEYMSGGNITNIISKYGALPEKTIKVYAKQILAGLIYLHENKVIHKDIKGANILVDGDGTVKLADFGCSTQLEKTVSNFDTFLANSLKGSIPWMAPEVVRETGYGRRSDIWSFGCTILEMATGKVPWSHYQFDNPVALLMKIALSEEIPLIPDTLSSDLKSFLSFCLQRDPKMRPHAQDLIIHPFLNN